MSMEQWCNDPDRGKLRYLAFTLSQCHFVHQKLHMHFPGSESKLPMYEAGG